MFGDEIEAIFEFDPLTGEKTGRLDSVRALPEQPLCDAEADAADGGRARSRIELKDRLE